MSTMYYGWRVASKLIKIAINKEDLLSLLPYLILRAVGDKLRFVLLSGAHAYLFLVFIKHLFNLN